MTGVTSQRSLQSVVRDFGVRMTATHLGERVLQDGPSSGWPHDLWKCVLRFDGRSMTVDFRVGIGWNGERPSTVQVLDAVLSDADTVDPEYGNPNFTDWCNEFGYSDDSIQAHRIFVQTMKQTANLRRLLGRHYGVFAQASREGR